MKQLTLLAVTCLSVVVIFVSSGRCVDFTMYWNTGDIGIVQDIEVADVDMDGNLETIVALELGYGVTSPVVIYDGVTKSTEHTIWLPRGFANQIEVADIDDDGVTELILGTMTVWEQQAQGYIYIYDGTTYGLEWESDNIGVVATMYVDDFDVDGVMEIFAGIWKAPVQENFGRFLIIDGVTHVVEYEDELALGSVFAEHATVSNMDGDAALEIVYTETSYVAPYSSTVFVFDGLTHSVEPKWSGTGKVRGTAVGDVDQDGQHEIIISLTTGSSATDVKQLKVLDASWVEEWSYIFPPVPGWGPGVIALESVNGDQALEILVGCHLGTGSGSFSIIDGQSRDLVWTSAVNGSVEVLYFGDVSGDGRQELCVGDRADWNSGHMEVYEVNSPNQPPVAACMDVVALADLDCSADASIDNGSYDPDGNPATITENPPGPYPLGQTLVTLTVTDDQGLSATCEATVTVVDGTAPSITCPGDIVVACAETSGAKVDYGILVTDNCDPDPQMECDLPSGSVFPIGTSVVNCTAIDAAANESTRSFSVTVTEGVGSIAGHVKAQCSSGSSGLLGVTVDVFDAVGNLAAVSVTDEAGYYEFFDLLSGQDYTVTLVSPLGYCPRMTDSSLIVGCNEMHEVTFDLACIQTYASPRSIGFWKHQFGVALTDRGNAQIDGTGLCELLDLVADHFNSNALNEVAVYMPPVSGQCEDKWLIASDLLNLRGRATMRQRAQQQLTALLLNVAAGYLSQMDQASVNGARVTQAITYCDNIIDDPSGDYELAKDIAETINLGQLVPTGLIPLDISEIAYRLLPTRFSLHQNYPNPFNPSTTIRFGLPTASEFSLTIYNVIGQVVERFGGYSNAGMVTVEWDASDQASGVYLYRLTTGDFTDTRKMILLK